MPTSQMLSVTVAVCISCLLVSQVVCVPVLSRASSLTDAEREEILHYASRIIRLVLGNDADRILRPNMMAKQAKRNSGVLDAVLKMPDLLTVGRK